MNNYREARCFAQGCDCFSAPRFLDNGEGDKVELYIVGKPSTRYFQKHPVQHWQPSRPAWKNRTLKNDRTHVRNQRALRYIVLLNSIRFSLNNSALRIEKLLPRVFSTRTLYPVLSSVASSPSLAVGLNSHTTANSPG